MIRAIEPTDGPVILKQLQELFAEINRADKDYFHEQIAERLTELYIRSSQSLEQNAKGWLHQKQNATTSLLLARIEERPLRRDPRSLYIDAAYTNPAHRGQGQMQSLLDEVLHYCRAKEIHHIDLGVIETNQPAKDYWEKRGFRVSFVNYTREI